MPVEDTFALYFGHLAPDVTFSGFPYNTRSVSIFSMNSCSGSIPQPHLQKSSAFEK